MAKAPHPPPLTGTALLDYIEQHVAYEVESLGAAWVAAFRSRKSTPERRCAVEAMFLHLRNLHDFFGVSSRSKKGDVLAIDADPRWPCTAILAKKERNAINKMLGRLTVGRNQESSHTWRLTDLVVRALDVAGRWAEQLPDGPAKRNVLLRRFEAIANMRRASENAPVDTAVPNRGAEAPVLDLRQLPELRAQEEVGHLVVTPDGAGERNA